MTTSNLSQYLFSDYTCAEVLSNEPGVSIVTESLEISGYELYIVEQWACERKLNTTITTYTGKIEHKITVSVLGLPEDTKQWSEKTREYFDELVKLHARPKETDHGLLFVTNLSSFPSNLNLVPIPSGDVRNAWRYFDVNEDLRRTGCGGRLVLTIARPPDACEDKFKQLFRTSDKVPILFAVREMVTLVQIGLFYCNFLAPQYVDGLLCNETLRAVNLWWDKWGQLRYHTRPKDGAFGSTTVAAIIGFVTGIRNRLASVITSKATKDPFDAAYFLESLRQFQKHEHLPRTMRIDDETIERLYYLTEKAATNADLFGIVKSTMKEVSGKQVQKIADPETLDLEKLKNFLQGPRERYLWLGKGQMRSMCEDSSELDCTGIPMMSLMPTEYSIGNRGEFKRVMKKTMSSQKQRTDDAIKYGVTKIRNLQQTARSNSYDDDIDEGDVEDTPPPQPQPSGTETPNIYYDEQQQQHTSDDNSNNNNEKPQRSKSGRIKLRRLRNGWSNYTHSRESSTQYIQPVSNNNESSTHIIDKQQQEQEPQKCPVSTAACFNYHKIPLRRSSFTEVIACENTRAKSSSIPPKRRHSFSEVSDVILQWELPYQYPSEKLVQTSQSAWKNKALLKSEVYELQNNASKYKSALKTSTQHLTESKARVNDLEAKVQASGEKTRTVRQHVQDIEALAARLQYEIRTIDLKMKDVEESVETFQSKVTNVESRLDRLSANKKDQDSSSSGFPGGDKIRTFFNRIIGT